MIGITLAQWLMISGLGLAFGAYFLQVWRKYLAGRDMIMNRDPRLYPPNYASLTKADRRRLYRIHSWAQSWDWIGRFLAAVGVFGLLLFAVSIILAVRAAPEG